MLAKLSLRERVSSVIRKHPYAPAAATLVAALAELVTVIRHMHSYWALGAAGSLILSSFVWGYATRALKNGQWPSLTHLHRRQYAKVWDTLAASSSRARAAACGRMEETELRASATEPINNLVEMVMINSQDDVLEIGCGVGRIGFELAPKCRSWTGVDMSANMLACASERLRQLNNVRLVKLAAPGLEYFPSASFDVVYSTNVFAHLDEIDRWHYVQDGFRVLRPYGRLFIDNVDLESDAGWSAFAEGAKRLQDSQRSAYQPRFSSATELMTYALRAGFDRVRSYRRPPLVIVTGIKPQFA